MVNKVSNGDIMINHSLGELPLNDEEVDYQGNLKV